MTALRPILAIALLALVGGCDEVSDLWTEASDKGGTDVPEAAREPLDPETQKQLRVRIRGQSFN